MVYSRGGGLERERRNPIVSMVSVMSRIHRHGEPEESQSLMFQARAELGFKENGGLYCVRKRSWTIV